MDKACPYCGEAIDERISPCDGCISEAIEKLIWEATLESLFQETIPDLT